MSEKQIRDLPTHARKRWNALTSERSSWLPVWQDIKRFIAPDMGRFSTSERNKGERQDADILDNSGTRAMRTLGAGLIAGLSSPAQPWFELKSGNREARNVPAVKQWLADVREQMMDIFAESNVYRSLHTIYEELAAFGTACAVVMEDFENVVHLHVLTAGEYALATDSKGKVNALYREYDMTVEQLVEEFGIDKVSDSVRRLYNSGELDQWVTVLHAIEPRPLTGRRDRVGAQALPWREVYVEKSRAAKDVLRESGYKKFNVLAPRWIINGRNVYGTSPGRDALGDVKQLQQEQLRKSQAIDYQTKPPLQGPTALKNQHVDMLPGGFSYADVTSPGGGIRPLFEVRLDLSALREDIVDVRQRISRAFYEDLFRMISDMDKSGITARQIAEQHSEKLMMLGPVIERVGNEALATLIELTFDMMLDAGIVAEPPEELAGAPLTVEFTSILAQAQKQAGASAIDRLIGTVGAMAGMMPDAIDKLDPDQIVDEYAHVLGVNPKLLRAEESLQALRQGRQQMQAQQMQAAQQAQAASTAKDLAAAQTGGNNMLTEVAGQLQTARGLGG